MSFPAVSTCLRLATRIQRRFAHYEWATQIAEIPPECRAEVTHYLDQMKERHKYLAYLKSLQRPQGALL